MVTVHTENAFVNLTRAGTLETINATEGDNISIACFALGFLYFYNSFTSSEKITPWVLPSSNVSLEGTEILVKSPSSFFIACYVEGRPKPKITWLKDGENIEEIIENNVEVSLRDDNQILEFKFVRTKYAGKYECSIENRVGHIQPFTNVIIEDEALALSEKNLRISIVSFIIILIISFSVVIFLAIKIKKRKNIRNDMLQFELFLFQEGKAAKLNKECTIEEQAELLPYDHSYEVERENITLGKQLGTGAFGRVLMAQVKGLNGKESPTRVAIKMCKYEGDKTHIRALIKELKIMIHLGKHLNIVNLMGAHTSNIDKGELWILVEYCKYGNLLKFIQRAKAKFINQIDPVTSDIDVGRTSPFPNDPLSPKSLGCSIGYGRTPNLNSDAYLDSHPGVSIEIGQPMGGHSSTTFNTRFTTICYGDKHYELPPADPTPRKESSISDSDYDFTYHLFLSSDMTGYSQTPSSPTSPSTSDCQAEPISSDSENIPGVSAPLTTTDLLCWAWQVANGMEYLSSRKVLHGDLAARNLLLASNNVVKICDFGLSREMYKSYLYLKKSNEMMPIKWMAPEAIEQRIFSIQSDVWSYGVTLWEMFTLGNTPFPGFPLNHLGTALVKGMRLEKPKYCNDQIYNLLLQCWRSNPVERPCFNKIADILSDMLSPNKTKSPMSEEGVIRGPIENLNTEEYISFLQSQSESRPIVDGGYLDVKFVRKPKTKSRSTLSAPSTQSQGPNNVSEKSSEEEGEQSLAEASTSLEKSEESSSKRSSIIEQNPPSGD
ncbi:Platelet-derived growth factor receptor alpha [Armadillidium vulgare]|nr:Platelet-derived growth factor receptor alpha [Armadillidium vulgare]